MNRRHFLQNLLSAVCFLVLFLTPLIGNTSPQTQMRCPVCGMFVKDKAPTSFSATKDKEPVHFCSFSCALAFHRRSPDTSLTTFDYSTGKPIPAKDAFYLIKSDKFAEEFKMAMAPVVVAFSDEASAKKIVEKYHEGQVVKGFPALPPAFGK